MAFGTSGPITKASPPVLTSQNSMSQHGMRVSDPKQLIGMALSQSAQNAAPNPLASALAGALKKRKKKGS